MRQIAVKGDKKTIDKISKSIKLAEKDGAFRVATRMRAIILSLRKYGPGEIAEILHVDRTRISVWINSWNEYGEDGLLEGHRAGRNPQLDNEMLEELSDIIDSGPIAYGLDTGMWNSIIITQVIEDEFGIKYHPGHVRKILKRLGYSVQRPTISLVNAEEKTKNKWIRYTLPNLKKTPLQKTAPLSTQTKRRLGKIQHSTKRGRR